MGISFGSFAIAGGLILLALSVRYMITGHMVESAAEDKQELLGVVPIGTPLTVGPATITTLLLLVKQQASPRAASVPTLHSFDLFCSESIHCLDHLHGRQLDCEIPGAGWN
jgi:small neutral amino acid transporter SnatA (MarC family)